jgi:Tfp pilus assembly protein PilF
MPEISNNSPKLKKRKFGIYTGIFVLALVVRLVYLYEISSSPTFFTPIIDPSEYNGLAEALAKTGTMSAGFFWQVFFYPLFLSVVYFFTGASILCAKLIQVILGSVVCVLVYQLGQKIIDHRTGILAGVFTALYGPLIYFDCELLATGWAAFWTVILMLLFLRAEKAEGKWVFFVLGVCGGLSIITRATFLPFFAITCIWLVPAMHRKSTRWGEIALREAIILAGILCIILPVSILCFRITGRFSPLPESGPINLYMGNNSEIGQFMAARPGSQWESLRSFQSDAESARQIQQMWKRKFWQYVKTQPAHFFTGLARKTVHFLSSREIPSNSDPYLARKYSKLLSIIMWKAAGFGFPFGILMPLALVGLVRSWRQIPMPLKLFLFFYPAAIILVFVTGRYRAPMVPVIAVLAASGILQIIRAIKIKQWYQTTIMIVVIVAVAILSSIAGPFDAEKVNYEAEMYFCLGGAHCGKGNFEKAIYYLYQALKIRPDYDDAHNQLGNIFLQQGKFDLSIQHSARAIEINPRYYSPHINMAFALAEQGKAEQAIEYFNKALELEPQRQLLHYYIAKILLQLGKTEQAKEHLLKVLDYVEKNNDYVERNSNQVRAAIIKTMLKDCEEPAQKQ